MVASGEVKELENANDRRSPEDMLTWQRGCQNQGGQKRGHAIMKVTEKQFSQ